MSLSPSCTPKRGKVWRDFPGPIQGDGDCRRDCKDDGDWRQDWRGVEKRFQHVLLERSLFSDVTFQVGTTVFHAHKLVLAIGSPVFEDMFYSFEEAKEDQRIVIDDLDVVAFKRMLEYLYSGSVSLRSISEALSTCEAGKRYAIPELRELSEKYLAEVDYKPSIVWPILENAEELNMALTKGRCLDFVRRNTQEVLKTEGFLSASLNVIQSVLKLNEVSVPEIELLDFAARWVKRRSRRNVGATRAFFASLAPFIRFKAIKPDELRTFMDRHPECLDNTDSTRILEHLVTPNSSPLPEWCNRRPPRENPLQPSRKTFAQKLWSTLKNPQLF